MTERIQTHLPEKDTYGAWVNDQDGDGCVTVYASPTQGVVIGMYDSFKDATQECDSAVSVKDGKITLQYHSADGEVRFADLSQEAYRSLLAQLFEAAKRIADQEAAKG